jgi:hypothetical protein
MKLAQFKNIHLNDKIIVLGCGMSAKNILSVDRNKVKLFGVNDISLLISPDYLICVDTPSKFTGQRYKAILQSNAQYFFTQIRDWQPMAPTHKVTFDLGVSKLRNMDSADIVDYSNNSPYMAVLIAYKMGCKNIGMLGVDFTPNHFYANDGEHVLVRTNRLNDIDLAYKNLTEALNSRHVNLYNLNKDSLVKSVPKIDIAEFLKK